MSDSASTQDRRPLDPEVQVAAAALTAAIYPPLGIAVAAGSALRSRRVREALRKGTVRTLASAIDVGDQLAAAAAARAGNTNPDSTDTDVVKNGHSSAAVGKS